MSAPTKSVFEKMQETLKTEFEAITAANDYRNTIERVFIGYIDIDNVNERTAVAIIPGKIRFTPINDKQTVFDAEQDYSLVGYIYAETATDDDNPLLEAQASLLHDLLRKFLDLRTKYLFTTDGSTRWHVLIKGEATSVFSGENKNKGEFGIAITTVARSTEKTLIGV